jgi:hypothetical protein
MRGREIHQLTQLANRYLKSEVAQQVAEAWNNRGDERAKVERQRRRLARKRAWASRWLTAWVLVTLLCGLLIVGVVTGAVADGELDALFGAIAASLVAVVITFRSALKLAMTKNAQREFEAAHPGPGLPSVSRPASTALPPKASAAREPMKRLADAEKALAQVLAQLAAPPSAVPPESVDQARVTSAEAANALRAVAAQMVAVELARDHAPPLERAPLIEGVARLRDQLDEGLDGYRSLVAAAGRVVAASSSPGPKQELTEATDHLAGLAVALRELSDAAG